MSLRGSEETGGGLRESEETTERPPREEETALYEASQPSLEAWSDWQDVSMPSPAVLRGEAPVGGTYSTPDPYLSPMHSGVSPTDVATVEGRYATNTPGKVWEAAHLQAS